MPVVVVVMVVVVMMVVVVVAVVMMMMMIGEVADLRAVAGGPVEQRDAGLLARCVHHLAVA
jgi:beta-lactam-binding protein with PASTA domain